MIDWKLVGIDLTSCNCNPGCPCQFNSLPSHGNCKAVQVIAVEEGHFGDVPLAGAKVAAVLSWPRAIHQGEGRVQIIIDPVATEAQRNALLTIFSGGETEPGATIWNVFAATFKEVLPPMFKPIDVAVDIDKRTGRAKVDGVFLCEGKPIANPVTGALHRVRINLPMGFEYETAEVGVSKTSAEGAIAFQIDGGHAHFARLNITGRGVVH
jgi:hypothetical protein